MCVCQDRSIGGITAVELIESGLYLVNVCQLVVAKLNVLQP